MCEGATDIGEATHCLQAPQDADVLVAPVAMKSIVC
jgi:hypothetical protein